MQNILGIQIDSKLDWNKHISTVAARGQSKLAFLNRNLKGCPKKLRDTAYISLIRPALEYSCSAWHPHQKSNKDQIVTIPVIKIKFVQHMENTNLCIVTLDLLVFMSGITLSVTSSLNTSLSDFKNKSKIFIMSNKFNLAFSWTLYLHIYLNL